MFSLSVLVQHPIEVGGGVECLKRQGTSDKEMV